MNYPKLLKLRIQNFESIEDATLEFDERNIIQLKGFNDSGKSAALYAIRVFLYNWGATKQVGFIRDGENSFRIIGYFADGIIILRDKYLDGSSLLKVYKDGKRAKENIIYSNLVGNTLIPFDEYPEEVKDYLGVVEVDGMYLNARDSEDTMLLVKTSGSENYKFLSGVLRTEELALSSTLLNADKNKKQAEINELSTKLSLYKNEYNTLYGYTEYSVSKFKEMDKVITECDKKEEILNEIRNTNDEIEKLVEIPQLEEIDTTQLNAIRNIYECTEELKVDVAPQLPTIDKSRIALISQILRDKKELDSIVDLPVMGDIDKYRLEQISKILCEYKELIIENNKINEITSELEKIVEDRSKLENQLKEIGGKTVTCKNCGSTVVLEG